METALAITGNEWGVMVQQAEMLVKSGFLPRDINTPQKAIAIMMLGRELGLQPWQALSTINVIQGKPAASPQLMLALIQRSGQLEDMKVDSTNESCTVTMKRKGQTAHTETFTKKDAENQQLWGKPNWTKQPKVMLRWRAVAGCARIVFSDIILGLYTADEMGANVAYDEGGSPVEPPPSAPVIVERVVEPTTPVEEAVIVEATTPAGEPVDVATGELPITDEHIEKAKASLGAGKPETRVLGRNGAAKPMLVSGDPAVSEALQMYWKNHRDLGSWDTFLTLVKEAVSAGHMIPRPVDAADIGAGLEAAALAKGA